MALSVVLALPLNNCFRVGSRLTVYSPGVLFMWILPIDLGWLGRQPLMQRCDVCATMARVKSDTRSLYYLLTVVCGSNISPLLANLWGPLCSRENLSSGN
jgi:hypothetical protein